MWYQYWIEMEKMRWAAQPITLCFSNADVLWPAASTITTMPSTLWWNTSDLQSCVESSLSSNFKLWGVCSCHVFCYRVWKVTYTIFLLLFLGITLFCFSAFFCYHVLKKISFWVMSLWQLHLWLIGWLILDFWGSFSCSPENPEHAMELRLALKFGSSCISPSNVGTTWNSGITDNNHHACSPFHLEWRTGSSAI